MQIEAGEAVQIEAQAFVPERVNQDPSGTHPPTTAWPRRMLAAVDVTQYPLVALEHRRVAVTTARPPRAVGGLRVRTVPSSNAGTVPRQGLVPERVNQYTSGTHLPATAWPRQMRPSTGKWWYRLGCRVPTYESGVRGREPPDEEITEQVISQGVG